MKRIMILLTAVVMVISLLAGCAESDNENTAATETENVTIKFAVQADSTGTMDEIVKAFNQSQEAYTVEAVVFTNDSGNMHDQLINSLSTASGEYDVVSMDVVWAGEFASAGFLHPLDTLIKDEGWLPTDFNAGSMASGKYKGKNYALPYFSDLGFLYFRKDIVSKEDATKLVAGDYSMSDLLTLAEKYQGEADTKYGHVYQSKQYEGLTCNVNEFTNNWMDINSGLETMKAFADSKATPDDILTYTEGETHAAFLNGETVFARNWPYMTGMAASGEYPLSVDQIGFAPLPNGGTVGGWILGINANSKEASGAEAFLKFIAGPKGQKINATMGSYLPGFNALLEDEDVINSNVLLTNKGFKNALKSTIARPVVSNYSEVSDGIQVKAHEYLSGNGELEDATQLIEELLK
ncbi:MAG: extracellular solute-binding protein [Clostridiales bacterium]|nr:extracellular solute-binding protein [Clostridiales bacterium]